MKKQSSPIANFTEVNLMHYEDQIKFSNPPDRGL